MVSTNRHSLFVVFTESHLKMTDEDFKVAAEEERIRRHDVMGEPSVISSAIVALYVQKKKWCSRHWKMLAFGA